MVTKTITETICDLCNSSSVDKFTNHKRRIDYDKFSGFSNLFTIKGEYYIANVGEIDLCKECFIEELKKTIKEL